MPTGEKHIDTVLFDRDGTLVVDVPYNGDPDRVRPLPYATQAVDRLRARGLAVAVITNQSGVGRGLISLAQMHAVHRRIDEIFGPFDGWFFCPHVPEDDCACRKPQPALIHAACQALRRSPTTAVVIGDIGTDIEAAAAAGARSILVPTDVTRREEIERAPVVATDLRAAVEHVLRLAAPDERAAVSKAIP